MGFIYWKNRLKWSNIFTSHKSSGMQMNEKILSCNTLSLKLNYIQVPSYYPIVNWFSWKLCTNERDLQLLW